MKNLVTSTCLAVLLAAAQQLHAQEAAGGAYTHSAPAACLSEAEYQRITNSITEARKRLRAEGIVPLPERGEGLGFNFPMEVVAQESWWGYYGISNFVDLDESSGLQDYTCESRTYNGHNGVDYFTWPFPWYLYENDLVHAVAAADGVIVGKEDGEFDEQCAVGQSFAWNAVYVEHPGGRVAWYGHLKAGTLTEKAIGETVSAGEYLGVVASSGNSSGAHLHFELYNGENERLELYSGDCNSAAQPEHWIEQEAYRVPGINALLTHDAPPELGCPLVNEVPHFSNSFEFSQTIYCAVYYRDQLAGDETMYSIIGPNGSVVDSWVHTSPDTYDASYWYWPRQLSILTSPAGVYTLKAVFRGEVYTHQFSYGSLGSSDAGYLSEVRLGPNPWTSQLQITLPQAAVGAVINLTDLHGRALYEWKAVQSELYLHPDVVPGVYYLQVVREPYRKVWKLVKLE